MKILQINKLYPPHLGGIENVVRDIAECLSADSSFQSDVLVCQEKGKRLIETNQGVKIYRAASLGRLFSLPISFDFFKLYKKISSSYDTLFIHHPYPLASLARLFSNNKKQSLVVWYHSDIVRQKFLYFLVYPFLYLDLKVANKIFVSSQRLAENSALLRKFISKCEVIPFGVDLKEYQVSYDSQVTDLKTLYGPYMLSVGRLVYYKGYLDLLEAMKTAPGRLLIIGSGPLEDRMKKMIVANNLQERVIIISDHPKNITPYYQASEFLIFPSNARSEAFGLVQIEAMACGKPVINTDLKTGVPEISKHNESGLTVPVNSPKELSLAIKSLWEDNALRSKLGEGAKKRAELYFSKDKFEKNIKSALLNIK